MRLPLFESLEPVCPACRARDGSLSRILLHHEEAREEDHLLDGILLCSLCQLEFPVLDGVPILTANPRETLQPQFQTAVSRERLSPTLASLIGDIAGQGSDWDNTRQLISIYAWDSYAEFSGEALPGPVEPGSVARCLTGSLPHLGDVSRGPWLDLGCAVGRSTFAAAAATKAPVLGIDLNFAMLRLAHEVLRTGRAKFDLRRVGVAYDRVEIDVPELNADNVDFWLCDALALPFKSEQFATSSAFNLIDCLPSPLDGLREMTRQLAPGARGVLTTPYDWSVSATPMEAWIGGHSQRTSGAADSEPALRSLLDGTHPLAVDGLALTHEDLHVPWHTRLHARSTMLYDLHRVVVEKAATG